MRCPFTKSNPFLISTDLNPIFIAVTSIIFSLLSFISITNVYKLGCSALHCFTLFIRALNFVVTSLSALINKSLVPEKTLFNCTSNNL